MFEIVRQDLQRCRRVNQAGPKTFSAYLRAMFNPGTQAILIHGFGVWADGLRFPPLRYLLRIVHFLVQHVVAWRVGIYIPVKADIGPGMAIHTWGGGVFLPAWKIGRNLTIVGGGVLFDYDTLEIGGDVTIGAGTKGTGRIRFGDPGWVIPKTSGRRKLAVAGAGLSSRDGGSPATPKPQSSAVAASVTGPRLATF